jgi:hypothetical protein
MINIQEISVSFWEAPPYNRRAVRGTCLPAARSTPSSGQTIVKCECGRLKMRHDPKKRLMRPIPRLSGSLLASSLACCALLAPRQVNAALAQLIGGSGYSADLSSNKGIRHQQLVGDPTPGPGSAGVTYNPSVVSLFSIYNTVGYDLSFENVGVVMNGVHEVESAATFFAAEKTGLYPQEWGYVQVGWTGPSSAPPGIDVVGGTPTTTGFSLQSSSGPAGVNTFGLEFNYLPSNNFTDAQYSIYAEPNGYPVVNSTSTSPKDFITQADSNSPNTQITSILPASVDAPLPEPSMSLFFVSASGVILATRAGRLGWRRSAPGSFMRIIR